MTTENEAAISHLFDAIKAAQPHIDALAGRATKGDSTAYELIAALERAAEEMFDEINYDRGAFEFLYADACRSKAITA
ncbi:hypothetical protein CDS [Bradyrhizobium sp.]|uniref:hypothetical protein n=1 Tax=unclassified Bradyrhizobium TaxID=2631580 RepID=UPI0007C19F8F|nr:hypothetical protein [Bradyrhizobium sp.]CUU13824.1 hypothetical protein CDS [Bradyrhizobium sp.]